MPETRNKPSTGTVRLHRVLRAPAERVYKAFIDPDAMVKWMPPHGFTGKMHSMNARVGNGGGYKMSFTNFSTGSSHSFGGTFTELSPPAKGNSSGAEARIRYTDGFDVPAVSPMAGEMQVTITMKNVMCGTELTIVQEGVPEVIPAEMCYLGWQESLELLAKLVDPEIPD